MKITNPITLDVARSNSYICLLAKQFDENSRFLIATLTNNGEPMIIPAGAAVTLRATRPDGEPVAVPGIINNDGTTTVEIDDYILEVVGSASLSIEVAIGDEILTSASFNLTIQRADGNGWLRVYVAAASLAAGNYYITIGDTPYAFTTTQAIPAGGAIYFNSDGGTAQTRDASGNVLDASLTLTAGTSGTELTSDVPTMSFLTAIAGRMVTIEAEMSQKANIDGSYPLLHAGTADNLMTGNGATQAIPFIQEGTGKGNGEATVKAGGVLQLKKKLGNTVCVNQLARYIRENGCTTSIDGDTITVTPGSENNRLYFRQSLDANSSETIKGHIYWATATVKSDGSHMVGFQNYLLPGTDKTSSANWTTLFSIGEATANGGFVQLWSASGTPYYLKKNSYAYIDLSVWYGSNDRIPSDLLAHPENWGRYYAGPLAYNAGTLESADGTVLKSIGRNVFDKSTYTDAHNYIDISGLIINQTYHIMAENTSGLIQYKIATASYATAVWSSGSISGVTFTVTQEIKDTGKLWVINSSYAAASVAQIEAAKVCLSLYYPGESGYDQYYPFSVLAEVDTGSEALLGYDWKEPNGTIHRNTLPRIDMGTLAVSVHSAGYSIFRVDVSGRKFGRYNLMCSKYAVSTANSKDNLADKEIIGYEGENSYVYFRDTAYSGYTEAQIQAALSGVMLECESATPTTEQGTAFAENIPRDDFGSLMWTNTKGIPQGNEIFYPTDLKGALESIVAAIPSANGTYTLHATVTTAGVTFSWS